ncbi:ABC transporter permease [Actinospica sp. MGRD01-02]|uniref:Transport permease protein n=1 Tax=Actinospica acidithermotolerans TaxID=2828514 RepID=A0A941IMD1_9ACTN|nr:ABC transporter permease [Actinospica acidithermotolerans]MBR7828461.1 ABC transporter permease [Actinospica acidithermotolerans]
MSTLTFAARDSATMLKRSLLHTVRYPVTLIVALGVPAMLLLLFVGVFGGALGAGSVPSGGRYIDYVVPGILLMTVGYGASTTSQSVNRDMTEGIIARFRTMAISRSSVLTGHVVGALIRTMVSAVVLVGVALLMGYRSNATVLEWLGAAGLLALLTLALSWLAVAVGLAAGSVEGTSGFALLVQLLPFISSAFVPTATMSVAVRWFAHNQPFTPVIDTLRGLLLGTPIGHSGFIAVAWCLGLAVAGFLWSVSLFKRSAAR